MKRLIKTYIEEDIKNFGNIRYLQVSLTNLCSENCEHCYQKEKRFVSKNLDYDKIIEIIDDLKDMEREGKRSAIAFIGGDPLLYKEIVRVVNYAQKKGLPVTIKGNPRLLNQDFLDKIYDIKNLKYNLSLDGLEETHDSLRSKGSYERTIEAITLLKKNNIKVLVKYTVQNKNYKEICEVFERCAELNVDYFDFARYCPSHKADMDKVITVHMYREVLIRVLQRYQKMKVEKKKISLLFRDHLWLPLFYDMGLIDEKILKNTHKFISGCSIGHNGFVVDSSGECYPCAKMTQYRLGDIRKERIHEIFNSKLFLALKETAFYSECGNCALLQICRGCPAINKAVQFCDENKKYICWK